MSKVKKEDMIVFEQAYLQSRVVELGDGSGWDIEFAILEGPSIGIKEENEFIAKTIYAGLDRAYKAKLKELQEEMLEALTKISDDAKEDVSSDTDQALSHTLDTDGVES
jgi:hypothetical protein